MNEYQQQQGYRGASFPAELAIMEAEAAGDPLGHGHAVLAMQMMPRRSRRSRVARFLLAALGWLGIAAIVLGGAVVVWGL